VDKESEEIFFKLISLKGTRDILNYLNEHGTAQHTNLNTLMSAATLNARLLDLLKFGLIEHHLEKEGVRKEWYAITRKGKRILQLLAELVKFTHLQGE
jgi:DNA-binding HxlR family transcriptional regulator